MQVRGKKCAVTEDQVTVPLAALRIAADRLCNVICIDPWTGEVLPDGHDVACLQPLLEAEARNPVSDVDWSYLSCGHCGH